jgi:tetratricopeptide (TPR) repeat protein
MEHLPEKRMGSLGRVLAKALGDGQPPEAESDFRERILHQTLGKTGPKPEYGSFDLNESTLSRLLKVSEEKALAPDRLAELLALSPAERDAAVAVEPRFQTYTLASHVLRACATAVSHDPMTARSMARLAYSISTQVDPRTCGGAAALADLQAYSLAMESNALRVSGDLDKALRLFEQSRQVQERGGADPDLAARIDHLEASLRRDLRQYDMALRLLDRAGRTFSALGDNDQKARTIINRSNVFLVRGDFEEAIATLRGALDAACSPDLALTVRHNLIDILAKFGRPQEAAQLFSETQPLYAQHTDPLMTCRRIWVEGIIARELGEDLGRAAALLEQASQLLAEHGYSAGAALAGLDLVAVYAKQGQAAEVLRTASDLVKLFRARKAHPETLAALSLVHQAAEREAVSLALLSHATSLIQKSGGMYEIAAS